MLAALRGQAASFEALAGPPYGMEQFKGIGASLREKMARMAELRDRPWAEVVRKNLEEWKDRPDPEEVAKSFHLLFYLPSPEGAPGGFSLPFPSENRSLVLEEWPCLTEGEVAEASVGEDLSTVLASEPEGHRYLLPDVCLSEGRFLDGMTVDDLPRAVEVLPTDGIALRRALEESR
jgi:hypothetical protein